MKTLANKVQRSVNEDVGQQNAVTGQERRWPTGHEDQPMKTMVKRMRQLVSKDGGHQVMETTHEDVGQWIMRECL